MQPVKKIGINALPEDRHLLVEQLLQRSDMVHQKLGGNAAVRAIHWIANWGPTGSFEQLLDAVVAKFQSLPNKASEHAPRANVQEIVTILEGYREGNAPVPTTAAFDP